MLARKHSVNNNLASKHSNEGNVMMKSMAKESEDRPQLTVKEMASMGGKARAKGLTKKRRKEIASDAAKKRWASSTSSKPHDS